MLLTIMTKTMTARVRMTTTSLMIMMTKDGDDDDDGNDDKTEDGDDHDYGEFEFHIHKCENTEIRRLERHSQSNLPKGNNGGRQALPIITHYTGTASETLTVLLHC